MNEPRSRDASLVVPNWNGAELLREGLPTLLAAAAAHTAACEVIVVDDGSSDDSVAVVEAEFPSVRLVVHERNRGFGEACGTGARVAEHPTLVLLNSDVRVPPDFLGPLVDALADPEVFAASPLVLDPDGRTSEVSLSVPYLKRGKIRYRRVPADLLARRGVEAPGPWYTCFPMGGAVALDRERFLALGGFDPLFHPFYYEDLDLGLRAWRRGWTCRVEPASRVTHHTSSTIGRLSRRSVALTRKRNRLLLHWKNLTQPTALLASFVHQAGRIVTRALRADLTPLRATAAALPRLPAALRARARERAAAVESEEAFFARIEAAWRTNARALEED